MLKSRLDWRDSDRVSVACHEQDDDVPGSHRSTTEAEGSAGLNLRLVM